MRKVLPVKFFFLIQCPPDEDINDFLANHVVDFYTRAKLVKNIFFVCFDLKTRIMWLVSLSLIIASYNNHENRSVSCAGV